MPGWGQMRASCTVRSIYSTASFLKSLLSSAQDTASPTITAQNGAPIEKIGTLATVTRKVTAAPRVKAPLNETTKARSKTLKRARPASVAMKTLGVASMNRVKTGENIPNNKALGTP